MVDRCPSSGEQDGACHRNTRRREPRRRTVRAERLPEVRPGALHDAAEDHRERERRDDREEEVTHERPAPARHRDRDDGERSDDHQVEHDYEKRSASLRSTMHRLPE